MNEKQKRQWIEETTKTVHQCIKAHHQKMKTGQKDIRKYFGKRKLSQ